MMEFAGKHEVIIFDDKKTPIITMIMKERLDSSFNNGLVVGCGSGVEAAVLAQNLESTITGIDLETDTFDMVAGNIVNLQYGDATNLQYDDATFDFVYSYHALEHIPDYQKALEEMSRVLKPGGCYCIGTPNRSRLLGYIGSKDASWKQKLQWNLKDYKDRFTGKFKNEYGAHAGYTSEELNRALLAHFSKSEEVTNEYYKRLYANHEGKISFLISTGISHFIFPSVYFIGYN